MKNSPEQFKSQADSFSKRGLSSVQKKDMLSSIYTQTESATTPIGSRETKKTPLVTSPYFLDFIFAHTKKMIALLLIISLSTVSYASAHSLPGDSLYPFKIKVIEPLVRVSIIKHNAKIQYTIKLLDTRIEEIKELQGKEKEISITEDQKKESREAFEINIQILEKELHNSDTKNESIDSENIKNELIIKQADYQGLVSIDIHSSEERETVPLIKNEDPLNIKINKEDLIIDPEKILPLENKNTLEIKKLELDNTVNFNSENSKKIIPPLRDELQKVESELLPN